MRPGSPLTVDERVSQARSWFTSQGRQPFEFQEAMWRAFWRGESGLLNAATGTGKTMAAWLGPLLEADAVSADAVSADAVSAHASAGIRVLWVTPLRALARDIVGALRAPLAALRPEWRVEERTADTSSTLRARQTSKPPHALVTTPESLSVMLSRANMASTLCNVRALIVDEWHEFLGTKRGVQLELVAARLRKLSPALRIWGMSATLPDLPAAMQTLLGPSKRGTLIRAEQAKHYDIQAILPPTLARFPWAGHLGLSLLPDVLSRIEQAGTTLVFTNTRSQAELWFQSIITARLDWLTSTALHHGSIDVKIRRRVEEGLKDGSLKCVVCTSSLDLGVDFPPVDQVLQVGSPKGVARLLQRAGRSGHQPGQISRATLVPTHAFELLECAAARVAAAAMRIEPRNGLRLSLDVLAQHLVTLAAGGGFEEAATLFEVRSTSAFAQLTDAQWRWTLDFITRGGSALQGYPQFRRVSLVESRYVISAADIATRHRRGIGTITSNASVAVKWLQGGTLGFIEESFIGRLRPGDIFIFAGRSLRLARVRDSVAYVRLSSRRSRFVPRWQGARLPLSTTLGGGLLDLLHDYATGIINEPEVRALQPLLRIQSEWSSLPQHGELLAEAYQTREGFHLMMFPFSGRILNEGVASIIANRLAREVPRTFAITSNEYGFELLCEEPFETDESTLLRLMSVESLLPDLLMSVNVSDLARRQFRDIAQIAGLIDAGTPGRRKSSKQLQVSSGLMFDVLERHDADNLLLEQSRREVLAAQLDFGELRALLARLGRLRVTVTRPRRMTPLAFPIWADRLQTQTLSTETWRARIERESRRLEKLAT
jgi:ATP-dependent helicase Lhr and Lhr-like helicase